MDELNLMNLLLFLASQNSTGGSGGGGTSVYISNCSIDENGDLIVTLSDGTVMNAGKCKGEDGADGKDGADGSNGKSAYEMWIDAGNTGTEEDFLNSLKGEKGDTGETGATGADGKDGAQGPKGDDGESPTINVYDASPGNYQLEIVNPDGTSYITPNLMGSGTSSTRYTVYKNSLYTSYLDSVYTIFNSELKSIQDYIDGGNSFCNENESYSLYYNTTDFGWSGNVITFNTVPISSTGTNMLLLSYTSGSTKDEKLKFIPTSLVTGSTNLEIAESIKSILTAGSEAIVTLDFDFNYSANNITEAIGLESVPVGDYYIAWAASSDNSQPKISSMIIM